MSGHLTQLPPELDQLREGRLDFAPWFLAELAAGGVMIPEATQAKPELGTDPQTVARATAALTADGILGPVGPGPENRRRQAELAFLAFGRTRAPGAVIAALGNDGGPDGRGSVTVELDLWPATTAAGELVLGALLVDHVRPQAFAAVATPANIAQSVVAHVMTHGAMAADLLTLGSLKVMTMRPSVIGGVKPHIFDLRINRGTGYFTLFERGHGVHMTETPMAVDDVAPFLAERLTAAVSS